MRSFFFKCSLLVLLILCGSAVFSSEKLEKRHRVELKAGWWGAASDVTAEVGVQGVNSSVGRDGFLGSVAYGRWLKEDLAVLISLNALALDIETGVTTSGRVSSQLLTVTSFMLEARYYLIGSDPEPWRPYLTFGLGPVAGQLSEARVDQQVVYESRTENALASHLGVGLDIQMGRLIMLGASGGYYLMTDFSEAIGDRDNYSGPELGMSISLLLGNGVN